MRVALVYPTSKACTHLCNSPVSLLGLATSLRDTAGQEVAVFDVDGYSGGLDELIRKVADYKPDVVGTPVITDSQFLKCVRTLTQEVRIKLPKVKIIVGGPHPSALPQQTLEWYPEVDMVLAGEADHTLCELITQLESNVAKPEVAGLCYRSGGESVLIPLGDPPKDLDALPIPDRSFLSENYKSGVYWRMDHKGTSDYVMTGRGCPFSCKFCFKVTKGYRARSAEHVVKELTYLASFGVSSIDIEDDLFTANKKRCIAICHMIRDTGLRLDMKVRSRVDTIDEELLSELKKAGVKTIVYGLESGSQTVLDAMRKKTSVQRNLDVVRMTKKAGLKCYADMFIGFPGETPETIAETERFLFKARPTVINSGVLFPLPCTEVYDEAKAAGTLVGDWSIDGCPPYVKLPWIDDISQLWEIAAHMDSRFYSHPAVLIGMLRHAPLTLNRRQLLAGWRFFRNRVLMKH
jgi:anaerobic magnesium-protoporphyrin IX monomethyl ester cyclase